MIRRQRTYHRAHHDSTVFLAYRRAGVGVWTSYFLSNDANYHSLAPADATRDLLCAARASGSAARNYPPETRATAVLTDERGESWVPVLPARWACR